MLHVLTHSILPVFAILAVGFVMGRMRVVQEAEARTLNRIAFVVFQPPLLILLIANIDLDVLPYRSIGIYFAAELIGIMIIFGLMHWLFGIGRREAALLGMTVVFVNSLLYLWPISILIYGEAGSQPIAAIVALDAIFVFGGYIIALETWSGSPGIRQAAGRLVKNPVLLSILVGLVLNFLSLSLPDPFSTGFEFVGAATAPLVLFSLGVILSTQRLVIEPAILVTVASKLFLFPAMVWLGFLLFSTVETVWQPLFVFNAAGPAGVMSFSLALLYGVSTNRIAPVIIMTSVLSLISLAFLA